MTWTITTIPRPDRCACCARLLIASAIGARNEAAEHACIRCATSEVRRIAQERVAQEDRA